MTYGFCPRVPSNDTSDMPFLGEKNPPNSKIAELLSGIRMTTEQPPKF